MNAIINDLTKEQAHNLHNAICQLFDKRAELAGWKKGGKKYSEMQAEFFTGSTALMDLICGRCGDKKEQGSTVSPIVYYSIIGGRDIEPYKEEEPAAEPAKEGITA